MGLREENIIYASYTSIGIYMDATSFLLYVIGLLDYINDLIGILTPRHYEKHINCSLYFIYFLRFSIIYIILSAVFFEYALNNLCANVLEIQYKVIHTMWTLDMYMVLVYSVIKP